MNEIELIIRQVVPKQAEIEELPSSGFNFLIYRVCWNLGDDPARPHKKSKMISVEVPYEMIQDLPNMPATKRAQVSGRVLEFLASKYAVFEPSHNVGRDKSQPVERWIIPPDVWSV